MNGITLEKLQVIIEAQTQDLRNELAKVKQQLTSTSSAVKKETGKISNSFGGMMKKVKIGKSTRLNSSHPLSSRMPSSA